MISAISCVLSLANERSSNAVFSVWQKNLWNLWNLCDNKIDVKHFRSLPWPLISPVFRPFQPLGLSLRGTPTFLWRNAHFPLTKLSVPPRLSQRSDLTHSFCKDFFFSMCVHGVTQLRSYAVSFAVGDVSFSNVYLYYIIYIIYYIYNINYFFLSQVTAQLHLMQLRNCVTV